MWLLLFLTHLVRFTDVNVGQFPPKLWELGSYVIEVHGGTKVALVRVKRAALKMMGSALYMLKLASSVAVVAADCQLTESLVLIY